MGVSCSPRSGDETDITGVGRGTPGRNDAPDHSDNRGDDCWQTCGDGRTSDEGGRLETVAEPATVEQLPWRRVHRPLVGV
ncbi:hypothetical protein AAFF_G00322890 [Aldrovandia affinis]|uniref:Uncharacterized protein n=1 Tax=Aldrovandia affinis TaxID=143900 RepID=A0AAD7WQI4_9TELE|nr:hypothetical protein AAFF_G00322890 [Aldrovandia affinis]